MMTEHDKETNTVMEKRRSELRKQIEREGLKFDYIKSNYFRVIHVDGVWGGVTPNLNIQMALFNERNAIPRQIVHEVKPDGTIGHELPEKRDGRDTIVREIEASLIMDVQTAKVLIGWLQDKVDQLESLISTQNAKKDE